MGNGDKLFSLKQLTKSHRIFSWQNFNFVGSSPKAMAEMKATTKSPQSVPPFCFCEFVQLMAGLAVPN